MQTTTTQNGLAVQQHAHPLLAPQVQQEQKIDVFETVKAAVARSMADLNHRDIAGHDLNYMINELTDNIRSKFPALRCSEIPVAFAEGIRGEYGEFYGLSVVTFEKFIKSYLASDKRAELGKSIPLLEAPKEPSEDDKFKTAKENALKAFDQFKKRGDFDTIALPAYSFLDRIKLISFSTKEKLEFMDEAKTELEKHYSHEKATTLNKIDRQKITNRLDALLAGNHQDAVIIKAKKLALKAFYQSIELEDNNLSDLIDFNREHFREEANNG